MKGRLLLAALSALFLTLSAAPSARAQDEAIAAGDARRTEPAPPPRHPPTGTPVWPAARGGTATLYARDPLTTSLCFADGRYGHIIQQNEVRNRCSDIGFGRVVRDRLAVGIEGGRVGVIIDLGDASELRGRYGLREAAGAKQDFPKFRVQGGKVSIQKTRTPQAFQELDESARLFAEGDDSASAPVRVGHVYLVRITDRFAKDFQRLAKVKVISYVPDESVTIVWEVL